jgi:hypothetical protein
MRCGLCRLERPVRYAAFRSNVGMLLARTEKNVEGLVCVKCFGESYRSAQTTNATLGWWGLRSLVNTPMFLASNAFARPRLAALPLVEEGADSSSAEVAAAVRRGRAVAARATNLGWGVFAAVMGFVFAAIAAGMLIEGPDRESPSPEQPADPAMRRLYPPGYFDPPPPRPDKRSTAYVVGAIGLFGLAGGGFMIARACAPPRRAVASPARR